MPAAQHPEYQKEKTNLDVTIDALNAKLSVIANRPYGAADAHAQNALVGMAEHTFQNLKDHLESPYFGRIDFQANDEEHPQTYYFGYVGFEHNSKRYVYAWQAAIATVYNQARANQKEYTYRNRHDDTVTGNLFLKRELGIESQTLNQIIDHYDRRAQQQLAPVVVDPDEYLVSVLEGKQDVQLQDIVRTIQSHQDELVRAGAEQVLVVQGAAGSGKTSIALQRLAYLLFPELDTRINPGQCIVFGPNRLFLGYIAGVLPRLHVRGITQKTLAEWEAEIIGIQENIVDKTLELLLSPKAKRPEKAANYKASQFKTSVEMGHVLDRYIGFRRDIQFPTEGWHIDGVGRFKLAFQAGKTELEELYAKGSELPFHQHREAFIRACHAYLAEQFEDAVTQGSREFFAPAQELLDQAAALLRRATEMEREAELARPVHDGEFDGSSVADSLLWGADGSRDLAIHYHKQAERRLETQKKLALSDEVRRPTIDQLLTKIREQMDRILPMVSLPRDYYALLENQELLAQLAPEHAELFADPVVRSLPERSVDRSDLPAMLYLYTTVNGMQPVFEHVVVDEAQDVAPLEFELLRRYSRNRSFTILGDLAQSIYSYRGIREWKQVQSVFAGTATAYHEINTSYRSTYEILTLAGRVLETIQKPESRVGAPQPIARHGKKPEPHHLTDQSALPAQLWKTIQAERDAGRQNIAIICKSVAACQSLARQVKGVTDEKLGVADSADFKYAGGVLIAPVHLAKGMEFQVVLLTDVDDKTYGADQFDGRLLYVAMTRALHVLHLFWAGDISVHLNSVMRG